MMRLYAAGLSLHGAYSQTGASSSLLRKDRRGDSASGSVHADDMRRGHRQGLHRRLYPAFPACALRFPCPCCEIAVLPARVRRLQPTKRSPSDCLPFFLLNSVSTANHRLPLMDRPRPPPRPPQRTPAAASPLRLESQPIKASPRGN